MKTWLLNPPTQLPNSTPHTSLTDKEKKKMAKKVKKEVLSPLVSSLYEDIKETLVDDPLLWWWNRLKTLVVQLKTSIDQNYSLISTAAAAGAEGADLLITWKQRSVDEAGVHQEVIHIAALELKDQRQTPFTEWDDKWNSLMSPLCILHWMPLFFPDCTFSIHFIFAGREQSTLRQGSRFVTIKKGRSLQERSVKMFGEDGA
jgi:hypothetical protein